MWGETVLVPVPPMLLPIEWTGDVVEAIEGANDRMPADMLGDPFDAAVVRRDCLAGRRQLWIVKREGDFLGLGVTGLRCDEETGRKTLCVLLVSGREWAAWAWTLGEIEAWGRNVGCAACRIEGRKGWGRRLPDAYRLTGERCGTAGYVWERSLLNG